MSVPDLRDDGLRVPEPGDERGLRWSPTNVGEDTWRTSDVCDPDGWKKGR